MRTEFVEFVDFLIVLVRKWVSSARFIVFSMEELPEYWWLALFLFWGLLLKRIMNVLQCFIVLLREVYLGRGQSIAMRISISSSQYINTTINSLAISYFLSIH